ncbi:hypothetical protein TVAG_445910 [Trichomonas vaginalis G3]|uniref:Uncharacterized protein n=1 Tax=Trichomonas vaginalis (strain ATCC PRA-98 / G3) TaxID=412133 RepID=A2GEJ0_TRIV3|nr:hypothetical protein TVAGG3_0874380 [Trichomonas vaginalis G3]EAX84427.1 hypothetical protein TVAG_445910 [Trichomonas vaginalis G3]KAI5501587.1 hypothetical protein TVAGG3_0874380 [Trichomonas vaginalis G3]|eukprot:XP_001297357.1 hypothetical protein [Trichomonas vaginalis G3]
MILHNSMKLEVYGVKNHDHIVVLDESKEPNLSLEMLHWIDATRDQQEFNDRMFMSIDYSNQIEAARLKDLKMSRIELKRKVFFKVMKNSLNDSMPQIDTKDVKTNIPDSKLSISPLPQFWECSQQQNLKLFRGYSEPNYPLDLKIDVKE